MADFSTAVAPPSPAPLDIRPPAFENPFDAVMKYRAQQQQLAIQQQQQQGLQLGNQLTQQKIKDQQAIAQALQGWDPKTPATSIIPAAVKGGASGDAVIQLQQHIAGMRQTNATADKEALDLQLKQHDQARGILDSIVQAPEEQKQQLWQTYEPKLAQLMEPGAQLPPQYPGDVAAQTLSKGHALHSQLIDESLKQQQTASAAAQQKSAEAETALRNAQTPGAEAESTIKKTQAAALTGDQSSVESKVDAVIDPQKYPDLNKRVKGEVAVLRSYGLGADKIAEALGRGAAEIGTIERETDPNVRKAKVDQAVAEARATAPIKMATSIAEAKALRVGDNPAVAGVAPASVAKVQSDAIKLDQDAIKAKAATESLGRILDLAEKGNKEAGSNLPLVGVETLNALNGIKRINGAEISQYGNAGDLLDQIKAKIGKITQGKPIPQDVLNDIRELHQTLGEQGYQQYTEGIQALNQRTGAKFDATVAAPNIRKPAAQAAAPSLVTTKAQYDALPKGALYKESDGKTYRKP